MRGWLERIAQSRSYAKDRRKRTKESRKGGREIEATHGWKEMVEIGDRWGESRRVRGHARTHVNLSAASRCYRGTTLMSCVLSILLRAPRQCIWPIVLHPRGFTIVSSRFATRSDHPAFYEPRQSANNQMKPLAYCRLRFVYDSSSWQHRSKFVESYFSSSNEDDRFSSSYELFRDLGSAVESTLYFRVRLKLRAIEDE